MIFFPATTPETSDITSLTFHNAMSGGDVGGVEGQRKHVASCDPTPSPAPEAATAK